MQRRARILCALTGGLLNAMAFAPFGFWPLVFVGMVLLLRALRGASVLDGVLAGLAWGMVGLVLPGRWAFHVALGQGESLPRALLPFAVLVVAPAVFGLVHVLARGDVAALLAPFAWIALETLRSRAPFVPCASFIFAEALADRWARPFSQVAELGGAASISFLVVAASVFIERGLSLFGTNRSRAAVHLVLGHGVPIIVWQIGFQILVSAVPVEAQLKSAFSAVLVQAPPDEAVLASLRGLAQAASDATPDVQALVWPDAIVKVDPVGPAGLDPALAKLSGLFGRVFVLGAPTAGGEAVLAFARDGRTSAVHHEGEPCVADVSDERLGFLFADELSTPEPVRELARRGASIIVAVGRAPSAWPPEAREEVFAFASLRACEARVPVLVASRAGPSFGLDELGRPYRYLPPGVSGHLLTRLSGGDEPTFHVLHGWVLPWSALGGTVLCLAFTLVQRIRTRRSTRAGSADSRGTSGAKPPKMLPG